MSVSTIKNYSKTAIPQFTPEFVDWLLSFNIKQVAKASDGTLRWVTRCTADTCFDCFNTSLAADITKRIGNLAIDKLLRKETSKRTKHDRCDGGFKPSLVEVLQQIPTELLFKIVAFEISELDLEKVSLTKEDRRNIANGYILGDITLYSSAV